MRFVEDSNVSKGRLEVRFYRSREHIGKGVPVVGVAAALAGNLRYAMPPVCYALPGHLEEQHVELVEQASV